MRVIVAGNRDWHDRNLARHVVNRLLLQHGPRLVIVHGGGEGIDRSIAEACFELGVEQEVHFAQWDDLRAPGAVIGHSRNGHPYNTNADSVRNAEMVAAGAEMCIAFHKFLAGSKGTKDCVRRAIEAAIPTYLIDSEKAEPRWLREGDGWLS
jgi:acetylglutamate kinase